MANVLIDCDVHPSVPSIRDLMPYLPEVWAESLTQRGLFELNSAAYPTNSPLSARPDWRQKEAVTGGFYQNAAERKAATSFEELAEHVLDPWSTTFAICNCLYGAYLLHSEDMAAVVARAINSWIAREWLDKDSRLRSSIVVLPQNTEMSVAEIEFWSSDKRFVQVLMPVGADDPVGRRRYWPIYEAAAKHGLPVGFHAGSMYRHPSTVIGWPAYYVEDYLAQAQTFQTALSSLICEGVFDRIPNLKVVLIESGFTWLPASIWRLEKYWQGLRWEVPWVQRPPSEVVRDHVRLTLQPVDAPPQTEQMERFMNHMDSDQLLLFSTDYPHWHFDGLDAIPAAFSDEMLRKLQCDNPLATYSRVREATQ